MQLLKFKYLRTARKFKKLARRFPNLKQEPIKLVDELNEMFLTLKMIKQHIRQGCTGVTLITHMEHLEYMDNQLDYLNLNLFFQ